MKMKITFSTDFGQKWPKIRGKSDFHLHVVVSFARFSRKSRARFREKLVEDISSANFFGAIFGDFFKKSPKMAQKLRERSW